MKSINPLLLRMCEESTIALYNLVCNFHYQEEMQSALLHICLELQTVLLSPDFPGALHALTIVSLQHIMSDDLNNPKKAFNFFQVSFGQITIIFIQIVTR